MQHVACHDGNCLNYGAPYTADDDERPPCPICKKPMDEVDDSTAILAERTMAQMKEIEEENKIRDREQAKLDVVMPDPDAAPEGPRDLIAALEALPADQPVTPADLIAQLREA